MAWDASKFNLSATAARKREQFRLIGLVNKITTCHTDASRHLRYQRPTGDVLTHTDEISTHPQRHRLSTSAGQHDDEITIRSRRSVSRPGAEATSRRRLCYDTLFDANRLTNNFPRGVSRSDGSTPSDNSSASKSDWAESRSSIRSRLLDPINFHSPTSPIERTSHRSKPRDAPSASEANRHDNVPAPENTFQAFDYLTSATTRRRFWKLDR